MLQTINTEPLIRLKELMLEGDDAKTLKFIKSLSVEDIDTYINLSEDFDDFKTYHNHTQEQWMNHQTETDNKIIELTDMLDESIERMNIK